MLILLYSLDRIHWVPIQFCAIIFVFLSVHRIRLTLSLQSYCSTKQEFDVLAENQTRIGWIPHPLTCYSDVIWYLDLTIVPLQNLGSCADRLSQSPIGKVSYCLYLAPVSQDVRIPCTVQCSLDSQRIEISGLLALSRVCVHKSRNERKPLCTSLLILVLLKCHQITYLAQMSASPYLFTKHFNFISICRAGEREKSRTVLRGVRLNRRFELQMAHRKLNWRLL